MAKPNHILEINNLSIGLPKRADRKYAVEEALKITHELEGLLKLKILNKRVDVKKFQSTLIL